MLKQIKNTPSIKLVERMQNLCNESGEIRSENGQPFYGEINISIQKGKFAFVRKIETIK